MLTENKSIILLLTENKDLVRMKNKRTKDQNEIQHRENSAKGNLTLKTYLQALRTTLCALTLLSAQMRVTSTSVSACNSSSNARCMWARWLCHRREQWCDCRAILSGLFPTLDIFLPPLPPEVGDLAEPPPCPAPFSLVPRPCGSAWFCLFHARTHVTTYVSQWQLLLCSPSFVSACRYSAPCRFPKI